MESLQASIEMAIYKSAMEHQQHRIRDAMAQTITELVKLHDPYLNSVQTRAANLAEAIAVELKLPRLEVSGIRLAAMLHCIGLVGIPSALTAYDTPLRGEEKAIFQNHPEIAWRLLEGLEFPYPVAEMVYQHMERLDGSGFPRGLSGEDILPGSHIVAVACEAAKMLTARGMKAPVGMEEAIKILEQGKGTLFEDKVVDVCIRLMLEKSDAAPA